MRRIRESFTLPVALCVVMVAPATADESRQDREARLLAVLESEAPAGRKAQACYALRQIGSERSVPLLAELLGDPALAHPARYALESMPYPAVDAALRNALAEVEGELKVGICITLGQRDDEESVPILAGLLGNASAAVSEAAADALGRIGSEEALAAIQAARVGKHEQPVRIALGDAMSRCAERQLAAGHSEDAAAVYRQLAEEGSPRPLRMAGLRGVLRRAGPDAVTETLAMLRGDDPLARQMAAAHISELPADALPSLAGAVVDMPPALQEMLLDTLAARREPSLLPAALAAAKSDEGSLKLAGLRALSCVGDQASVEVLVSALFSGDRAGQTARWSLVGLRAEGADEALVAVLQGQTDPERHAALVDVLAARRSRGAVPVLLEQALADDAAIRPQAMAGLATLAGPESIPGMVRAMLKAEDGPQRDEAERAVMLVCQKIGDPARRADPVMAAIDQNADAETIRILPLLGRIGGPEALKRIRGAIASDQAPMREAGVRALCNWPTDEVADELLALARSAPEPSHRIWSLRALIRVITRPEGRPRQEKVAMLREAMELATRDEERELALSRAPALRGLDTFRWARSYLDDAQLRREACRAVVEMAHHRELREPNAEEFDAALRRVIEVCNDPPLAERARSYLSVR